MTTNHPLRKCVMGPATLLLACLTIAAVTTGCDKRDATSRQIDEIRDDTAKVAHDIKEYSYDRKDEFVSTMRSELDEINRELDRLAARIERAGDAAGTEVRAKLQALRGQTAELTRRLEEAGDATESSWDDFKSGFGKGYQEVKHGFDDVRQWASDKLEP